MSCGNSQLWRGSPPTGREVDLNVTAGPLSLHQEIVIETLWVFPKVAVDVNHECQDSEQPIAFAGSVRSVGRQSVLRCSAKPSVKYSESGWSTLMVINNLISEAAARFEEDGYVVLDRVFSEEEIAPVSDEIECIIAGERTYIPDRDLVFEPNTRQLRNAFRLALYNPVFLEFAKSKKLTGILGELLGHPLRLYGSQLFAKPARVGTIVPKHQDMPYWPFDPPEMITAWIALDDSTMENGCVRFFAGSHKLGMLPHAPSNVSGNSLGLVDHPAVNSLPQRAVEVKRGSVVLHHSLTVHYSGPNLSERARRGLVYVYMSPKVRLIDPDRMKGPAIFPEVE